ncbi:MAG: serine/threonine-protein kinase, partial [Myxococcota bacterium]
MNTTHADVGRALAIFEELVELPKDAQRVALDAHCADHPRLQGLVLRMLEADDASRGPVHTGGADVLIASDIAGEMPATLGGYRVLRQLGAGGMGVVYEAEEDRPRRTVAIKTIHPWLVSPETRAWFEAEAHALGSLVHPGVPQIYAVGEDHDVLFVAMERVEGVDLRTALDGRSATERVRLVRALCDTVAHIHGRGLVHRDLKPANVRVTPEGVPKLLDFGLARTAQQGAQPMAGTLPYMAPELLEGPAPPDVRTDVYAMGVILFEALTGALPAGLRSDSFAEARTRAPSLDWAAACRDLDPDLAAIIIATTASDPADRFSTMDELGRELDRFLTHEPVLVRQGGWAYAVGKLFRRRPLLVGSSAVALAALVLTSVVAVLAAERSARDAREQAALRAEADVEAARALAFSRVVERVVLRANPRKATGERTLLDVTHSTAEALDAGDLAEHPVEQARMRAIVAETLFNTGDLPAAQAQLDAIRTAWTDGQLPDGPEVVDALHGLSAVARRDGRLAE